MRSLAASVNLGRTLQCLFQLFEREVLAASDLEDGGLAAAAEFGGLRDLGGDIDWNHDRAVAVGVNEIVGANCHSGNAHFAAETLGVDPCMRRTDRPGERLKSGRPLRNIADRSVGDDAETT